MLIDHTSLCNFILALHVCQQLCRPTKSSKLYRIPDVFFHRHHLRVHLQLVLYLGAQQLNIPAMDNVNQNGSAFVHGVLRSRHRDTFVSLHADSHRRGTGERTFDLSWQSRRQKQHNTPKEQRNL